VWTTNNPRKHLQVSYICKKKHGELFRFVSNFYSTTLFGKQQFRKEIARQWHGNEVLKRDIDKKL